MAKPGKKSSKDEEVFNEESIEWKQSDGKRPYLETSIDRLYETVKAKQGMSFIEAASEFKTTKEQVASWAKILEDSKLARVHYPFFGSPVMFPVTEDNKKGDKAEKGKKEKSPGRKVPKLAIGLAGGLLVFLGYVMMVTNPFTLGLRSSIMSSLSRVTGAFGFLQPPFNTIIPLAVVLAAAWAIFGMKRKKKTKKRQTAESRLASIKKELG
jgi:hypothetical protein